MVLPRLKLNQILLKGFPPQMVAMHGCTTTNELALAQLTHSHSLILSHHFIVSSTLIKILRLVVQNKAVVL